MNSSSNEALGAALIASLALHAALIAATDSQFGAPWRKLSWHVPDAVLRARLSPAPEEPAVRPAPAVEAGRPALPAQRYYRTNELDVRPGIMTRVQPEYPEPAARHFVSGSVRIQLYIDETGRVERVQTLRAEPPGYFEQSAERAFLAARFTPAMKGGKPVKVRMVLEVSFEAPAAR